MSEHEDPEIQDKYSMEIGTLVHIPPSHHIMIADNRISTRPVKSLKQKIYGEENKRETNHYYWFRKMSEKDLETLIDAISYTLRDRFKRYKNKGK